MAERPGFLERNFGLMIALAIVWMFIWAGVSGFSGLAASGCESSLGEGCYDRISVGWTALMWAQAAWIVLTIVFWSFRRFQRWGFVTGLAGPPASALFVFFVVFPGRLFF